MKIRIATLLLVISSGGFTFAGSPVFEKEVVVEPDPEWGGPILGGGVKANAELVDGSLFLVYPFMNTIGDGGTMGGSIAYFEPYLSWGDGGDVGVSLGLGFRHLFSNQSVEDALNNTNPGFFGEGVFVGANLFLDYGQTVSDNEFWQGGIGLEAGTRYVEVRANGYFPITDDQTMGRFSESTSSSRSSSSSRTVLGAPTVQGSNIVQSSTVRTTTTTRTTTETNNFELFEEALEGWDVELAVLVPGLDESMDLKLLGGYYSYSGDRGSTDFEGWKVGAEFRPLPAVVFHGTWFETEDLYDDTWLAGVRFEVPLEGIGNSLRSRRRHLAERLFEPVHRKNSAITTGGVETDPTGHGSSTHVTTTTSNHPGGTKVIGMVEEEEEEQERPE